MTLSIKQPAFNNSDPPMIDRLLHAVDQSINDLIKSVQPTDLPISSNLQQAVFHHIKSGGQRIRARLALHAASALSLSSLDAVTIATSVELVHNASLIHDDIQDRDRQRRGHSSVWVAYGDNVAICAGDLMLSMAYQVLAQFSQPNLVPQLMMVLHNKIAWAIAGQCADLQARQHSLNSLELYEKIVIGKSGALLTLPIELVLIASGRSQDIAVANQVGQSLALGYQIVDDLNDLDNDSQINGTLPFLNICLVLQAMGSGDDFRAKARDIGMQHLKATQNIAQQLPKGLGNFISDLARRLAQRL